jgi:hypothetical protein
MLLAGDQRMEWTLRPPPQNLRRPLGLGGRVIWAASRLSTGALKPPYPASVERRAGKIWLVAWIGTRQSRPLRRRILNTLLPLRRCLTFGLRARRVPRWRARQRNTGQTDRCEIGLMDPTSALAGLTVGAL